MTADLLARIEQADDLLAPPFADGRLPELPQVLAPLLGPRREPGRDVVVLLDGVGAQLLSTHRALTPTLRALEGETRTVRTVFPSTTATAMVSLLTGLAPIEHGVLGFHTLDRAGARPVNELRGQDGVDPGQWMPEPTPAEHSTRHAIHVGPSSHRGSHLSRTAFRGWEFMGHRHLDQRADVIVQAVRRAGPDGIVHVHVDDVDHAGHRSGVDSDAWCQALAQADGLLGTLRRRLPAGTRLHVLADHGMVQVDDRVDFARHPGITRRIGQVAGEGRMRQLSVAATGGAHEPDPDTIAHLAQDLQELLGQRAIVAEGHQAQAAGLWGPTDRAPSPRVASRIPDVLVIARGALLIEDSRTSASGTARRMGSRGAGKPRGPERGAHGSLTPAEALVPLITTRI
jgi:hypothetical protein